MRWNRRINMKYLLILLILYNIICNVHTIQRYDKTSFSYKLFIMKGYKQIPYLLWNWIAVLTYTPYTHYLIYFVSCAIIYVLLLNLLMWLIKIPWLFAIIIMLIVASAAIFYTNCLYSLFKRKKKKKTNDNK